MVRLLLLGSLFEISGCRFHIPRDQVDGREEGVGVQAMQEPGSILLCLDVASLGQLWQQLQSVDQPLIRFGIVSGHCRGCTATMASPMGRIKQSLPGGLFRFLVDTRTRSVPGIRAGTNRLS